MTGASSLASLPRLTLVLGGARSGKSRHAEALIGLAPPPWTYLATAEALDAEMKARIGDHQARRGQDWRTLEAPLDLARAISEAEEGAILIDCLTLWLSNILLAERDIEAESARLVAALERAPGPIVAVSNEVGLGIVPDTPLGRRFRDAQGLLNQRIAAIADQVVLMTAGIPLTLKSPA
ncbi:bifunctional adenosylcobinamide kinase/adenosylcobinamide-phosphate guanylyltransferase [Methyloligella sp. 2.7D]|uniref:bifunctional adenosylcobinamide kinase/adenosylcobinamide-phosphate guanylyltransferase n=1 Tax=unclassified Methyloligella TaxID=2625955 RepID=UPI00157CA994|nr:bifunctional adenosylcobinamide kinase/adenosylcobinamide-phosphate guanylyltransferase [Methyloligella sp. GL2]QKP78172.1 bifunctional adenosylcobinamide kinase/adenosylcobinamide-phosphate guanylyltransferase [Methyloligella sp. GL2]